MLNMAFDIPEDLVNYWDSLLLLHNLSNSEGLYLV